MADAPQCARGNAARPKRDPLESVLDTLVAVRLGTVRAGRFGWLAGASCRECRRRITAGQVVIASRIVDVEWGDDRFVVHVACIERLIAEKSHDAPISALGRNNNPTAYQRHIASERARDQLVRRHRDEYDDALERELVLMSLGG